MTRRSSLACIVVVCALAGGCGGGSDEDPAGEPAVGQGSLVARCEHAALGNGDRNWRDRATAAGRVGFIIGPVNDFEGAQKIPRDSIQYSHPLPASGPVLGTKTPVVLEGTEPVELSIAPEDRARAGLVLAAPGGPYAEVRLIPCRDQARTGWPAGWALSDREPVRVLIEEEGKPDAELVVG